MAKKNALISVNVSDNGALVFTVTNAGEFTVNPTDLSEEIRNRALVHGLVQKISDAAAIAKAELPEDATEAAKVKFAAMQSVAERLAEGEWSKRNGEGAGPVAGVIYRAFEEWALARAKAAKVTKTPAEIRAVYDAKSRSEQLALRTIPEVKAIVERMQAERGAKSAKVDATSLLADLGID